jgi:hypothetical protein
MSEIDIRYELRILQDDVRFLQRLISNLIQDGIKVNPIGFPMLKVDTVGYNINEQAISVQDVEPPPPPKARVIREGSHPDKFK